MRGFLSIVWLALVLSTDVSARQMGTGRDTVVVQDLAITVYTYRPPGCAQPALLFVFHGKGRNADRVRDNARPLADRMCLLVIAPLLDRDRFPNWRFHRAGVVRKGHVQPRSRWTDALLLGIVNWARRREGQLDAPYYLFGHSAGAQFLSRIAAYAPPPGAARVVIANPSAYVMPSLDEPAPYGMGGVFGDNEAEARLTAYLSLPITIYLGAEDTGNKNLVRNAAAKRQGANRFERGKRVFQIARDLASEKGWDFNWKLVVVPGVGHSSRRMLAASQALQAFGFANFDAGP